LPPSLSFLFTCSCHHRALHSFPTRRSSDLCLQVVQSPDGELGVGHHHRLGDLQHERGRRETGLLERGAHVRDDRVGLKLPDREVDRKSTRLNSSHRTISYAVFCLKKKKKKY